MRAGQLRHRVTIQSPSASSAGAYGGKSAVSWSDYKTDVPARIRPLSGKSLFTAQAEQNRVDTEITIRYLEGVIPSMRIVHGSTIYDINAVVDVEMRNEKMLLFCSTGVNEG